MLLATGLFMEIVQFLQIISWIVLPALSLVVILTIYTHYRRKKKKNAAAEEADAFHPASAEEEGRPAKRGAYLLFDHSGLIRQYRNKLSYHHARYAALRYDFEKLQSKYDVALGVADTPSTQLKITNMENTTEQLQLAMNQMSEEYAAEKNQLLVRLEQLDRSYKNLELENESLLEQIGLHSASGEEKAIVVNRWREENDALKKQVMEQDYLKDVIEEKKTQIEFLQNQVDLRIRNYHAAEQQRNEMSMELQKIKQQQSSFSGELEKFRTEAEQNQQLITSLKTAVEEKENLLQDKQQALISRLDQVTYLENLVHEIKEQNELLNASVADQQDKVNNLQELLDDERAKSVVMEQKLLGNKQLLQRLYKEFTTCMEEATQGSPIVTLRPSYISKVNTEEWDETAVQ
jgi:chromosome segregation ATPase/cbb3-type cytochrome oxidase subunit 3